MANPPNRLRTAVIGDIGDTRTIRIDGLDDLTLITACRAHVWKPGVAAVTLTAAVADSSAAVRTVTVQLGTWLQSTATAGDWSFEIELDTSGTATSLTFPESPAILPVRAEGA